MGNEIIINNLLFCALGGFITWLVANCYYQKQIKDTQKQFRDLQQKHKEVLENCFKGQQNIDVQLYLEQEQDKLVDSMAKKVVSYLEKTHRHTILNIIRKELDVSALGSDAGVRKLINKIKGLTGQDPWLGQEAMTKDINLLDFFKFVKEKCFKFVDENEVKNAIEEFQNKSREKI